MNLEEFTLGTHGRRVVDITDRVAAFASSAGGDGLLHVFAPHATAGLALMETGSGSEEDLEQLLERLLPRDDRYAHRHGSVGHGGDHLLPTWCLRRSSCRSRTDEYRSGRGSGSFSSTRTERTTRAECGCPS